MEGDKDIEMILEEAFKQSTMKEINLGKNAVKLNASQINALSFNNKFQFYHVHLQFLCFHLFLHKAYLPSLTSISLYLFIFRTESIFNDYLLSQ